MSILLILAKVVIIKTIC